MRVAIVHDYLMQQGGAEKVLMEVLKLFPEAPLYTLVYNPQVMGKKFEGADIRPSFLQHLPAVQSHYQFFLPLMTRAIESLDLREFDLVISSASSFAKGILTKPGTLHICYCHAPTRYIWDSGQEYIERLPYSWPLKAMARQVVRPLKRWDVAAAQKPQVILANSHFIKNKIKEHYNRDAEVIYPPVGDIYFAAQPRPGNYFLAGGRFVWYKRFDVIVKAFNRIKLPLKIFGSGPDYKKLKSVARSNIEWLGFVPDSELPSLYAGARAYIHPQEEDFGISAVEAMATGTPVIAFQSGGAAETVIDGRTGKHIDEQSWEALADAVVRFRDADYSSEVCRQQAENFSTANFRFEFTHLVDQVMGRT